MSRNLARDLSIPENSILNDLLEQPSIYAHYAAQHAKAVADWKHALLQLDIMEAALDKQIRDAAHARGQKITEGQISAQIRLDTAWFHSKQRVIELEAVADQMKGVVVAMAHKKDALVAASHDRRQELRSLAQTGAAVRDIVISPPQ